jgi:hypothetical protein
LICKSAARFLPLSPPRPAPHGLLLLALQLHLLQLGAVTCSGLGCGGFCWILSGDSMNFSSAPLSLSLTRPVPCQIHRFAAAPPARLRGLLHELAELLQQHQGFGLVARAQPSVCTSMSGDHRGSNCTNRPRKRTVVHVLVAGQQPQHQLEQL